MIEFKGVTKVYDGEIVALESIDLLIEKGEFIFIHGPSGAGKSTLLKLIYMDELPEKGEVIVGQYTSSKADSKMIAMLRRQIGVVFQDFLLIDDLTVFENVALPLRVVGKRGSEISTLANKMLQLVGLSAKRHKPPRKLSGGEQQRVAMARAIALRPSILLADEPTGSVDPETALGIFDMLEDINRAGATVVVATHDISHAQRLGKRVIELCKGKILSDGRLF
ncbi:MAG: cell division ATP-binding protein FtsE [bacterium]